MVMANSDAPELEFKRSLIAAIEQKMREENLSIADLAERMRTGPNSVRRILDAQNTDITVRSMSRAVQALGLKIKLVAEPMSPQELGKLAHQLAGNEDPHESTGLADQIIKGFYAGC